MYDLTSFRLLDSPSGHFYGVPGVETTKLEREHMNVEALSLATQPLRIINVVVGEGDGSKTFQLPHVLLECKHREFSAHRFVAATAPIIESGVWRRPHDDVDVWEAFNCWLWTGLPPYQSWLNNIDLAVRCWSFGGDRGAFQDAAMLVLLHESDVYGLSWEHVKKFLNKDDSDKVDSGDDSLLRQLMIEELVLLIYHYNTVSLDDFDVQCDYETDYPSELLRALQKYQDHADSYLSRFDYQSMWKEFMNDDEWISRKEVNKLRQSWDRVREQDAAKMKKRKIEEAGNEDEGCSESDAKDGGDETAEAKVRENKKPKTSESEGLQGPVSTGSEFAE